MRARIKTIVRVCEQIGHVLAVVSVIVAVAVYLLEADDRKKEKHYRAWELINAARGSTGDGGRRDALEDLNKDRVSLVAAPLAKAYLANIKLPYADLRGADLQEANLFMADLREALLFKADLSRATLLGAKLRAASLSQTNLTRADLRRTDLREANLYAADLRQAKINEANLAGAELASADLRGALGLTCNQLTQARHWMDAARDPELACGAKIPDVWIEVIPSS